MLIRKLLKAEGIESDHAINGKLAVEMHRTHPYRMVVSDWMMHEMSGIELCKTIRESESYYLYFVLCSAKGERADRLEAFEAGVDDFLRKPLDKDDLRSRLTVARRVLSAEDKLNLQKRELQRAGDSLQEMNANLVMASRRFAELFNGLPVACFTFDESGLIHEWNRSAESMFGVPSYKAFQQQVWEVLGKDGNDFWTADRVKSVLASGGQTSADWDYKQADGSVKHFACNVFALRNQAGDLVGAISANLDVTERFEAQ